VGLGLVEGAGQELDLAEVVERDSNADMLATKNPLAHAQRPQVELAGALEVAGVGLDEGQVAERAGHPAHSLVATVPPAFGEAATTASAARPRLLELSPANVASDAVQQMCCSEVRGGQRRFGGPDDATRDA
jgi:hypothetical protein